MPTVKIGHLDMDQKVLLLQALWNKSHPAMVFRDPEMGLKPLPFDVKLASAAIVGGYIDYFQGRAIKTDLSGEWASSTYFDYDHGEGAFQACVEQVESAA